MTSLVPSFCWPRGRGVCFAAFARASDVRFHSGVSLRSAGEATVVVRVTFQASGFDRFDGRPLSHSSFSSACLISKGDFVGKAAFPIRPFGVPSRAFNERCLSCVLPPATLAVPGLAMGGPIALDGVAKLIGGGLDLCPPPSLLLFFALCFSSVRSVSVLPTLSATCTSTASLSSVNSSPSSKAVSSFQCMSPMKLRGTSYTMTRLLNVWKRRKPSCQRFCLRRMSCV